MLSKKFESNAAVYKEVKNFLSFKEKHYNSNLLDLKTELEFIYNSYKDLEQFIDKHYIALHSCRVIKETYVILEKLEFSYFHNLHQLLFQDTNSIIKVKHLIKDEFAFAYIKKCNFYIGKKDKLFYVKNLDLNWRDLCQL